MKVSKAASFLAYFLFLLITTSIGAEIFLRILLPSPQQYYIWPPNLYQVFEPSEETTPGVSGAGRFRTNSLGLRSDEPIPDRKQTIYIFGGSTAIDLYLDQDRAWVQQVQIKLNAMPDYPKTWVGNLGRSSMATMHNLLMFKFLLPDLPKPDLFVNLVGVNDLQLALKSSYLRDMSLEDHMSWTFSLTPKDKNFWKGLATVRFYHRMVAWYKKSQLGPTQTSKGNGYIEWRRCRAEAPPANIVDQLPDLTQALIQYRKNLNELVDNGNAMGAPTIFLTQPTTWSDNMGPIEISNMFTGGIGPNADWCKEKRYYSPRALAEGMDRFNKVLRDVCKNRNLYCIDLEAKVPKQAKYFYDEMHASNAGADLFSDAVTKGLLEFKRLNGGTFPSVKNKTASR